MKKKFREIGSLILSLLLIATLASCGQFSGKTDTGTGGTGVGTNGTGTGTSASSASGVMPDQTVTSILEDTAEEPDLSSSVAVALSDSAKASGTGFVLDGGVLTVTEGGTYVLSGTLSDGRILVNAPKKAVVLLMDGVHVTCSYGSPLYIYKSSVTTVYLNAGTENTLTDGSSYTFADALSSAEDEEPNACLYSKSDLILAGAGTLTVQANYRNGITGKDALRIENAKVSVTAVNNGINGKDSCVIKNAEITVSAVGDAIRSTNDSDSTLGYIIVSDSVLDLTAGEDGIQAETCLVMNGGSCRVLSGGGSTKTLSSDASAKGLKAGSAIRLLGGTYVIDACDDAVHSNGSAEISGGSYTISTGDDGVHADETVEIRGGEITIKDSYEGAEGANVYISGGTLHITASDDGINAAGGADQSGFGGRPGFPGGDSFGTSSGSYSIGISGGVIYINAAGDGLDSNGAITVSGGEVYVSGPTDNGNGALDFDGTGTITGGIVVAAGSSGMAQNFGTSSTQGSILLSFSSYSTDPVTVTDADGNVLASYTPEKQYNCVTVSAPGLVQGGTYTVSAGGKRQSMTLSSLIYGGTSGMGGGGTPGGGGRPGSRPGGF